MDALSTALERDERFAAAVLFGSAARGELRDDSDVDVAVLFRDDAARRSARSRYLELIGRLSGIAGRDVHLVDLGRADVELRRRALTEGRTLFERVPGALARLLAATLIEYADWAYARRVIDEGQRKRLAAGGR